MRLGFATMMLATLTSQQSAMVPVPVAEVSQMQFVVKARRRGQGESASARLGQSELTCVADDDTSGATAAQTAALLHRLLHGLHESLNMHAQMLVLNGVDLRLDLLGVRTALDVDLLDAGVGQGAEELGGDNLFKEFLEHNGGAAGDDDRAAGGDGRHRREDLGPVDIGGRSRNRPENI